VSDTCKLSYFMIIKLLVCNSTAKSLLLRNTHYVGNLCNYFPENLTRVQLMHSFHYQMRAK